ncbi:MAG: glycosyltransferase family 39 protein [Vicinamibacterales bacterium]|jgi:4-amino-4-deoxy-L-arabinose transferase-like glycosyltransferase|nr:glycosyltransferase family 39 protein [Vicinamibacterales bacterium]
MRLEWLSGGGGRPQWLAFWLVLAAGSILRLAHLGAGIPYAVGIDEPAIMTTVTRILKSGDFNPHFFEYPTGYIYVQLGGAVVTFLLGAMRHAWRAVEQVGPSDFYYGARLLSVAIAAGTIALVHQAGLRWGARAALAAAALLAVLPMHVRESHFALTDTPLTFAAALTLLLTLRASERPSLRAFLFAGAAAGFAAGIKYNGLMAVSMPLVAAFATGRGRHPSRAAAAAVVVASCVAAFFVTTPYAIFDLPAFLNGFGTQAAAFSKRSAEAEPSWLVYAKHMRLAFGWPGILLCLAGFAIAVYQTARGPERMRWLLLLVFPAVYFYLINGWGFMFARYAMPIVPFMSLWAGIAMIAVVDRIAGAAWPALARHTLVAALVAAAIVPPLLGSVRWVQSHGARTTQEQAWKWLRLNIWQNSLVLSEARGLDLPSEQYRYYFARRRITERDPNELVASGIEWIILSSDAWGDRPPGGSKFGPPAAYAPILERYHVAAVIRPSPDVAGPEIQILKLLGR